MAEHADRAFLEEMLAPLGGVSFRRMFGGLGLFREGLMFGLVVDGDLYLKALPEERAAFSAEGGTPFSPEMGGRTATMISYWRAPDRLGDDPGAFLAWARRACAAARLLDQAKPAGRRKARHLDG